MWSKFQLSIFFFEKMWFEVGPLNNVEKLKIQKVVSSNLKPVEYLSNCKAQLLPLMNYIVAYNSFGTNLKKLHMEGHAKNSQNSQKYSKLQKNANFVNFELVYISEK